MRDLFWLSQEQLAKIKPYFPLAHGVPRVVSGIIFVIKNGLRWCDTPVDYGLQKPCIIVSFGGAV